MFLPFRGRNAVTGLDLHFSSFSRKKNGDRTRSAFFSPSAGEKNRGRHQFLNWCRQVSAGHLHFDGFSPGQDQKREEGITFLSFLVPVTGLEPVRCRQRWILSPVNPLESDGIHRKVLACYRSQKASDCNDFLNLGALHPYRPPHLAFLRFLVHFVEKW